MRVPPELEMHHDKENDSKGRHAFQPHRTPVERWRMWGKPETWMLESMIRDASIWVVL